MIDVEKLKRDNPLPGLLGRTLKLERRGKLLFALCPFHAEKTPSLRIEAEHFHCYGCGEHGDVLDWVMLADGVNFAEAARRLGATETDGGELRQRRRVQAQEAAAAARRQREEYPFDALEAEWEARRDRERPGEMAWCARFRDSADRCYLDAQWERDDFNH